MTRRRVPDPDQAYDHLGNPEGGRVRYITVGGRKPKPKPEPKPPRRWQPWQEWEERAVLERKVSDSELAQVLDRSENSIAVKRRQLKQRGRRARSLESLPTCQAETTFGRRCRHPAMAEGLCRLHLGLRQAA